MHHGWLMIMRVALGNSSLLSAELKEIAQSPRDSSVSMTGPDLVETGCVMHGGGFKPWLGQNLLSITWM